MARFYKTQLLYAQLFERWPNVLHPLLNLSASERMAYSPRLIDVEIKAEQSYFAIQTASKGGVHRPAYYLVSTPQTIAESGTAYLASPISNSLSFSPQAAELFERYIRTARGNE
jgi:hypothetical protein